ncbi:complement C5-like [Ursus arctos]|uniref:complement C5-like n=1 Tax=Ursus arctos TaxID=9644 RepID=UPI0025465EBD|nr:complement C5-like [Ursus arctos]
MIFRCVVSASTLFYVGTSENVVIQVHGYTDSFAVTTAIKSYPDNSFTYSFGQGNLSPGNKLQSSANLMVQPKDLSGGPNSVSYVYLEVVSDHFSKATKIPPCYDNGFLFIQTVKVRIDSLDEDLKSSQREATLPFIVRTKAFQKNIGPEEMIKQWPTHHIAEVSFPLAGQAVTRVCLWENILAYYL